MSLTVERSFQMSTVDRGRKTVGCPKLESEPASPTPIGRIPRITRLMALAIKLESYVQDGVVVNGSLTPSAHKHQGHELVNSGGDRFSCSGLANDQAGIDRVG